MNDPNKIQVGDFVHVDFNCARFTLCHRAEVLHVPSTMNCVEQNYWSFRDTATGQIHYVSEGCTISKLKGD